MSIVSRLALVLVLSLCANAASADNDTLFPGHDAPDATLMCHTYDKISVESGEGAGADNQTNSFTQAEIKNLLIKTRHKDRIVISLSKAIDWDSPSDASKLAEFEDFALSLGYKRTIIFGCRAFSSPVVFDSARGGHLKQEKPLPPVMVSAGPMEGTRDLEHHVGQRVTVRGHWCQFWPEVAPLILLRDDSLELIGIVPFRASTNGELHTRFEDYKLGHALPSTLFAESGISNHELQKNEDQIRRLCDSYHWDDLVTATGILSRADGGNVSLPPARYFFCIETLNLSKPISIWQNIGKHVTIEGKWLGDGHEGPMIEMLHEPFISIELQSGPSADVGKTNELYHAYKRGDLVTVSGTLRFDKHVQQWVFNQVYFFDVNERGFSITRKTEQPATGP